MPYSFEIIRKEEQTTNTWSGGTTTQIAIFPRHAVYSQRDFVWRLSSATVELEESNFTSLPGIWRLIMVLEGQMQLCHEGHHSILLKPLEQDSFSGDWITKSYGKVRDFNLMLSKGCKGTLTALAIPAETLQEMHSPEAGTSAQTTTAFYCATGSVTVEIATGDLHELNAGDVLLIYVEQQEQIPIVIRSRDNMPATIVRADIHY